MPNLFGIEKQDLKSLLYYVIYVKFFFFLKIKKIDVLKLAIFLCFSA